MLVLAPHPHNPATPLRRVAASARRTSQATLSLAYRLEGELARLRIPERRAATIGYRLWRHTCCEAFIAAEGETGYHEFNLSPSGEWTAHAFTRYREGAVLSDPALDPQIAVRRTPQALELSALVDLRRLSLSGKIRVGLSVVAEHGDGGLSYWALRHPAGKPDFHHREAFALELDETRD
jgi:hypothetical protein